MAERVQLTVQERGESERGSRRVRQMRAQGLIPGVLYGEGHNRAIVVQEQSLRAALTGDGGLNAILDVLVEGDEKPHHAVLKDYQQHPIRGTITHFDFHEVRLDRAIQAVTVVHLVGDSEGVKVGGVLQQVTRELNVEALPMDIPESIEASIDSLEIGDVLRLEDLDEIEGVTFLDDPHETVIASVTAPRVEEEPEEEEEELEEGEEGELLEGEEGVEAAAEGEPAEGEQQPEEE